MNEILLACAKGCWQDGIVRDLLRGGEVRNPLSLLRGKAKLYSLRYEESFRNLRHRLHDAGAVIEYIPGPRGGAWGAHYRLVI